MKQTRAAVSQLRRLESPFHTEEIEVGVKRLLKGFALTKQRLEGTDFNTVDRSAFSINPAEWMLCENIR